MNMDSIDAALADLALQETPNYTATAKKFNINRTTLSRRHRGLTSKMGTNPNPAALLSPEQSKGLVDCINRLTTQMLPPTTYMVRRLARDICGKPPGKNWVNRFINSESNTLDSAFLNGADLARGKADNEYQYRLYFNMVGIVLDPETRFNSAQVKQKIEQYDIQPHNQYNMDEKGFLIGVLSKARRVFDAKALRSGKLLGSGQDGNREWVTLIGSICMDGTYPPPSIIYQADSGNLQDTWLDNFNPEEQLCFFTSSATGWTNEELGLSWLVRVFDPYTKSKARQGRDFRLLFVDGHNSHVNMKFLDWCDRNRILVAVYPPHSTHRLQPLDVSLYSPLAHYYSQNLDEWIHKTQGLTRISKRHFFSIFWPAFQSAFTTKNVFSGWERTGLHPFDPEVVLSQIRTQERPNSSSGGSGVSVLSTHDWRKVRKLVAEAMAGVLQPEARKMIRTIDQLTVQNSILTTQNTQLRETVRLEKDKRRRGKPLFDDIEAEGDGKAMFFSPSKIQRARDRQQQKEHERDLIQVQKQAEKQAKRLAKEEKQLLIAQRKAQRLEARLQREKQKAEKQRLRQEATDQRIVAQQLQSEASEAQKHQKKRRQSSKFRHIDEYAVENAANEQEEEIRVSRSGRQIKARKQLDL